MIGVITTRCRFVVAVVWLGMMGVIGMASTPVFISEPTLTSVPLAPLSCVIQVDLSQPARVIVEASDGVDSWRRDFFRFDTQHSIPLHGFKAGANYEIQISVETRLADGARLGSKAVSFSTPRLPNGFIPMEVLVSDPSRMEPGFTLFRPGSSYSDYAMAVDANGEVVWYIESTDFQDLQQLANGHIFAIRLGPNRGLVEIDFLGQQVSNWAVPLTLHHSNSATRRSSILGVYWETRTVDDYPINPWDPGAVETLEAYDEIVVELSRSDGGILHEWSLMDVLDPRRLTYSSYQRVQGTAPPDWGHVNAVIHDATDDSLIVSMRNQYCVIKIARTTGELMWILGPHENWTEEYHDFLLEPVSVDFAWPYTQHATELTPEGTLLMFDNGVYRAVPPQTQTPDWLTFSRAVEYSVDERSRQIRQVWEYGSGSERFYCPAWGDANWMPITGNVMATFGWIRYVNGEPNTAKEARIVEVTHTDPPEKVFELALREEDRAMGVYRCERIFDFYAKGDLDLDGDVDAEDLEVVLRGRGQAALSSLDPRDLDRDGSITALDAHEITRLFYSGGPTETDRALEEYVIIDSLSEPAGFVNDRFGFTVVGTPDRTVVVEASDGLSDWVVIGTVRLEGGMAFFEDSESAPSAAYGDLRFYRARLE